MKYEIELLKNNNNSNNTVNNTINIVKFGSENLSEILSENEMLKITEFINSSVNESIKRVHFNNKRPELKNIRIKNLKDKHLEIHNGKKFITDKKSFNSIFGLISNNFFTSSIICFFFVNSIYFNIFAFSIVILFIISIFLIITVY